MPKCTSFLHRSSPRCEGLASRQHHQVPVLQTGTSAGVEPATCGYQAAALPSELTCGGMKQSDRAVRARATRSGAQAGQVGFRTHCRCTLDVSTSSRDLAQCSVSNPPFPSRSLSPSTSRRPKRRDPGRQCRPGSHGEIVPGTAIWSAPQLRRTGLTHHNFQGARRCTAGIHKIPRADFQCRALPRAKGC
jgi:hypothetical protein